MISNIDGYLMNVFKSLFPVFILSYVLNSGILISETTNTEEKDYPEHIGKQRQAAIYFSTARKKHGMHDFKAAVEYYTKVLKLYPNASQVIFLRANASSAMRDYKSALNDYARAIELKPDKDTAYYERGRTHISMGNVNEGCSDLLKAEQLGNPDSNRFIQNFCKK